MSLIIALEKEMADQKELSATVTDMERRIAGRVCYDDAVKLS